MYSTGNASPKAYSSGVTKYSDYFVWKDTSERVARRCDDTVDKKRVNSCVLKHLFLEGVELSKISPKTPGNALSDALLMARFQNFAADATKQNCAPRETVLRAVLINSLIWINSGPNILKSCLLHCLKHLFKSYPLKPMVMVPRLSHPH